MSTILSIPAIILAIGAIFLWKSLNAWWVAHPSLSNGPKAKLVPAFVVLVAWMIGMSPWYFWAAPPQIWWIMFACFAVLLVMGAWHVISIGAQAKDAIDHALHKDGNKPDNSKK